MCGDGHGDKLNIFIRAGNQALDEIYLIDNLRVFGIPDADFSVTSTDEIDANGIYQQEACVGGNIVLSVSGDSSFTYTWTGPNGFSATEQTATVSNATAASFGTYTVTAVNSLGCEISEQIFVTQTASVPPVFNNLPTSFCKTDPVFTLPTTSDNGATGTWICLLYTSPSPRD